jgi:hypothetical protein
VVTERPADVEEVVVGVDEEVRPAGALQVIERGDSGADQRAGTHGPAGPPHYEAQAVVLAEALPQLLQGGAPAGYFDRERRALELPRGVHECDISDLLPPVSQTAK